MRTRNLILGVAAVVMATTSLGAQDTARRGDREALVQRFRQRFGEVVKQQLQLNDSQVARLGETNRRFEEQRRLLLDQERDVRMALRDELLAERQGRGNQERIATMLDRAIRVQRQRVELLESEQRELASFLNPAQRAKLLGMQEQLRRNAGEMRGRASRRPMDGPPGARLRERRGDSSRLPLRRPPARFRSPE